MEQNAGNRHPGVILEKVQQLLAEFADSKIDAHGFFDRLEAAKDLDQEVEKIRSELNTAAAPSGEVAGPSKVKTFGKFTNFLSADESGSVDTILQMFPDADPYFVVEHIAQMGHAAEALVDTMTTRGYPKLKDRLEKERIERRRRELLSGEHFDCEEFLRTFEDPEQFFSDVTRHVSELYKQHALVQLMNDFQEIRRDYLEMILERNNNHYLPTYRMLLEEEGRNG